MYRTLPPETVALFKSYGFRVFMYKPSDSYAYVGDDTGVCYVQIDNLRGYTVHTRHRPSRAIGTGYCIYEIDTPPTKDQIARAIRGYPPEWAGRLGGPVPVLYPNVDAYVQSSAYTRKLIEV